MKLLSLICFFQLVLSSAHVLRTELEEPLQQDEKDFPPPQGLIMGLIHHTLPPPPVFERDPFESEGDSDKNNDGLICNEGGEPNVIVCEEITNLANDVIFRHRDNDYDDYREEEVISKSEPEKSDSLTTLGIETNESKPGGSHLSTYSTIGTTSSEMDNYHSTGRPRPESTNKESSSSFLEKLSMPPVDKNEKNKDGLEENEKSDMAVQEKIIKLDNDIFLFPEEVSLTNEEEISKSELEKSDLLTALKIETSESKSKPGVSEMLESIEPISNFLKIKPEVNDVDKDFTTYVETEKKNIDVTKPTNGDTYDLNTGISHWLFLSNILQPNMQNKIIRHHFGRFYYGGSFYVAGDHYSVVTEGSDNPGTAEGSDHPVATEGSHNPLATESSHYPTFSNFDG